MTRPATVTLATRLRFLALNIAQGGHSDDRAAHLSGQALEIADQVEQMESAKALRLQLVRTTGGNVVAMPRRAVEVPPCGR